MRLKILALAALLPLAACGPKATAPTTEGVTDAMIAQPPAGEWLTYGGTYNISPSVSPDGKMLAYISRREGKFQLYILDLTNSQELRLSETGHDESPSFAPNGRVILYATKVRGRGALAAVSSDGKVRQRLNDAAGDVREPAWGPLLN